MIVNCRIDDKTSHTVVWLTRKSSNMFSVDFNVFVESEKEFDNFMDASGFVSGLKKRNITVLGIVKNSPILEFIVNFDH